MRGKGPKAPFVLLTLALLLFRKKKPPQEETTPRPKPEPFPVPEIMRKTVTTSDAARSRDALRLASLERDIIGDALTKIYEAEAKGHINEMEKNQLLQRHKTDLKRVDGDIDTHKKIVDLYDLESAKEDLLKSFQEKLLEIDARISQIRPATSTPQTPETKTIQTTTPSKTDTSQTTPPQTNTNRERSSKEKPKNKADEKLEAIREEVLKAMERLEQIETEG